MLGTDLHPILLKKGISHLYHANSVVTSYSLLQLRGIASRGCVEKHGLSQTKQYTDTNDRCFGIWDDVFTDRIDIHARISKPNKYGPVLFVLNARILLELPDDVKLLVTKTNPTKWVNGQTIHDRYFTTVPELAAGLTHSDFGQMITFQTADGILPFGEHLEQIILDNPQTRLGDGSEVFTIKQQSLQATAEANGIFAPVAERSCKPGCKCIGQYASGVGSIQKFL